ncbi:Uncharacterised protein [Escherichia coli]|uniref:Uncharacterized protein n=1 Tax=Escherichia coli TaxID=562 RepID=A0A377DMQ0_ECOLX|nr:Uncharacterised protein [Escherichia coli]
MPSVGQRQVEIGVLVDVLLTVGSVVLAVGTVTGAVTVVAAGLLFGNILLALCSPEDSEYVIVGCDATATVEFCAGLITNSLLCCVGLGNGISASDWRTGSITHLQGLTNVQRVWCLNIVALSKVTEIVASNPGDIEKCVAFFHGIGTAAITAFRNVPILTVIDDASVFHLYRLLSYWLHWLDLRLLSSLNLWLLLPAEFAVAAL